MSALQFLRSEPNRAQSETGQEIQGKFQKKLPKNKLKCKFNTWLMGFNFHWVGRMKDELIWNAFAHLGWRDEHKNGSHYIQNENDGCTFMLHERRTENRGETVASALIKITYTMWAMKNNKKWVANKSFTVESLPPSNRPSCLPFVLTCITHTCLILFFLALFFFAEPDTVRPAFRGRGPNGVLRFHATIAELQAPIPRMRGCQAEELHHADISTAAASMFRYVCGLCPYYLVEYSISLHTHTLSTGSGTRPRPRPRPRHQSPGTYSQTRVLCLEIATVTKLCWQSLWYIP